MAGSQLRSVLARFTQTYLSMPGVSGASLRQERSGADFIIVVSVDRSVGDSAVKLLEGCLPNAFEGVPVKMELGDPFEAQ